MSSGDLSPGFQSWASRLPRTAALAPVHVMSPGVRVMVFSFQALQSSRCLWRCLAREAPHFFFLLWENVQRTKYNRCFKDTGFSFASSGKQLVLCLLKIMEGWTLTVWEKPHVVCSQVHHLESLRQLVLSETGKEPGNRLSTDPVPMVPLNAWADSHSIVGPPQTPSRTISYMPLIAWSFEGCFWSINFPFPA